MDIPGCTGGRYGVCPKPGVGRGSRGNNGLFNGGIKPGPAKIFQKVKKSRVGLSFVPVKLVKKGKGIPGGPLESTSCFEGTLASGVFGRSKSTSKDSESILFGLACFCTCK